VPCPCRRIRLRARAGNRFSARADAGADRERGRRATGLERRRRVTERWRSSCDGVAADPPEIGADRSERPVGALELLGVGVALRGDQRELADRLIGLAQQHAGLLRQPHQPLARPVHQLRVGRGRHGLRLHGRVDDDAGEVRRLRRAGAGRGRKALLKPTSFSSPIRWRLPRQRRAVEGRLVREELFAAEQLKIRVLDPARKAPHPIGRAWT
jgi:hypothetical protein